VPAPLRTLGLALLLPAALVLGCGRTPAPRLAPVQGRVIYRGQPVAAATVEFTPDADAGTHGPSSVGSTGPDGSFRLRCPPHGEGAVVGRHRARVFLYPGADGIPPRYAHPDTSPLRVEVPAGGLSDLELVLED
jgi:hypothetical protein